MAQFTRPFDPPFTGSEYFKKPSREHVQRVARKIALFQRGGIYK